ncbi:uncharacterized protein LOC133716473 [Rosa rugosa]|uniref:uncharacterized protein LOC133716473 n=1 Tax=Rosa rugosa TaxID=74645 RepID=UPI002B411E50|nr:uncharacterized protein LOC133716473 [Rosa rugosa]
MATSLPPNQSFASILSNEPPLNFSIDDLLAPIFENGFVSVQISEDSYLRGLGKCKTNLVGRLVLPPKASPLKSHELSLQLRSHWPTLPNWTVSPLGKGFFMLHFQSLDDMQKVWSLGIVRLNQGFLILIKWKPGFSPSSYKNSFSQVWVRFWDLGFDYWEQQTLFEIARRVGMPLKIDPRTVDRSVGLYARILIDVDFSQQLLTTLRVTRVNGSQSFVGVEYENVLVVCAKRNIVGYQASNCRVVDPQVVRQDGSRRGRSCSSRRSNRSRKNASLPATHDIVVDAAHAALPGSSEMPLQHASKQPLQQAAAEPLQQLHAQPTKPPPALTTHAKDVQTAQTQVTQSQPLVLQPMQEQPVLLLMELAKPQCSDHESSIESVPPGFQKAPLNGEGLSQRAPTTSFNSESVPTVHELMEVNSTQADYAEMSFSKEEGEFTPVLSKKAKKQLKQVDKAEKSKGKPQVKVPVRALVQKGAKHLRF